MPEFVATILVPAGLMLIMFSLGLSLTLQDFRELLNQPKPVMIGLGGQLLLLPLIALLVVALLSLPPAAAVGLVVLAACPGGVTSNAIVFAARADVALSVSLTVLSSCITVLTTPLVTSWGLGFFYAEGTAPALSVMGTMRSLFLLTVLPVSLGMLVRRLFPASAQVLIAPLRPVSIIVLLCVIGSSLVSSWDVVLRNLAVSLPAALALNLLAMSAGLALALMASLPWQQVRTVTIEVGVQNATMATFVTLSILGSMELAIAPTIYGLVMVANAFLVLCALNRWREKSN